MEKGNDRMIKKNDQTIVDSISNIFIVFLRAQVNKEFIPDISYHLHFLSSQLEGFTTVICLDTGFLYSKDFGSDNISSKEILNMGKELCNQFLVKAFDSANGNIENPNKSLFINQCEDIYWKRFNEIKKDSFYKNLKKVVSSITEKTAPVAEEIYKVDNLSISFELNEYRNIDYTKIAV